MVFFKGTGSGIYALDASSGELKWRDGGKVTMEDMKRYQPIWTEPLSTEFYGATVYTANLAQAKIVWNFSVRSFVRAILQYQDLRQNPAAYGFPVDSRSQGLFTQFLFSYKLNPRTVLFLGYSDNAAGGVFDSWLGPGRVSLTRTDRTFFLKIGYAWQI